MNCQSVQNKILSLTDPRRLPEVLRAHVDECPACVAWYANAVRLERYLEILPAPPAPADKKFALIDELTADGPVIKSVPKIDRRPSPIKGRHVAALAASLLIAVGGWWVFTGGSGPPPVTAAHPKHPLLDKMVQRNKLLARADTPGKRLVVLGDMADDLNAETKSLARVASPEELNDLAHWFGKVVNKGIVQQAGQMAPHAMTAAEKVALFNQLAGKLSEAGAEVEKVSREAPTASQPALKKIADTARDGQMKLRAMAREVL
ncbi:MAG TPA: hypothetical protein VMZ71_14650 [Gemmataceae bacterium]|nr:hypothetical protein [Gemmataceae bacterium]